MARFRLPKADVSSIHYTGRGLDRNGLHELSACQFIDNHSNVIFQGFTGTGKTFLACALGKQACKKQIRTKYTRLPDLLLERDESGITPRGVAKLLKKYCPYKLLVLDEWLFEDISSDEQHFIFELIERRHDAAATIFCTQYRQDDWHARLGGGVHADAIMDRIVYNAVWVETGTMNMREYRSKNKL
jgi:DNA replication protein DnaC